MKASEQKVKKVWPDAAAWRFGSWRDGESFYKIYTEPYATHTAGQLGIGESEDAAWDDAASKMEGPQ